MLATRAFVVLFSCENVQNKSRTQHMLQSLGITMEV